MTFQSLWDHLQVVEEVNEIYIYKYKLGRENVQQWKMYNTSAKL